MWWELMLLVAIVVDPRFRILITLIHSATISGLFPALWLVHWTKKISANTIPLFIVCKNTVFPHSFCHTFRMFRGDSKRMMEKNGVKAVVDWFFQLWPPAPKSFVNIEQLVWVFFVGASFAVWKTWRCVPFGQKFDKYDTCLFNTQTRW